MFVVTGATGNTGSAVANHLLAEGKKVRGIGRSAERLQRLAQKGAEPFVADVTDSQALTRAFQGAEAVYVMIPPDYSAADVVRITSPSPNPSRRHWSAPGSSTPSRSAA